MNSLNSWLLSVFVKDQRFGADIESLRIRVQTLSIIYVNIFIDICLLFFNLTAFWICPGANPFLMPLLCYPISFLSYFSLRYNADLSAFFLIIKLHCSNVIATQIITLPIAALYGVLVYAIVAVFLTPSFKIHIFNVILCLLQFGFNSVKILKIFEVTLTDEQSRQISSFIITSLNCIVTVSMITMFQKRVESNVWKIAQENYKKSENLTREVVQAMEAKDNFISMLSHEIRNPLNSLKGSVDYLLQVVKNAEHLQILRNAKLSGEILLNLISNVLDAAKLKTDKMEIICTETSLAEAVTKVLTINSENLKEKELKAEANIDQDLPRIIWTDPSRLLQIFMNLVSNAIKFTPKNGKIRIDVAWRPSNEDKNSLLAPFALNNNGGFIRGPPRTHRETNGLDSQRQPFKAQGHTGNTSNDIDLSYFEEFGRSEGGLDLSQKVNGTLMFDAKFMTDLNASVEGGTLMFSSNHENWTLNRHSRLEDETLTRGEKRDSVTEDSERNKGYLKIQVSDTGCGIPEENIPKLFGMFEQVTQQTRSVQGGTGLGLWICKQLCQKMGGDIALYSKLGQGTSFVLYIPVNNDKVNLNTNTNLKVSSSKRIKAMVVDDYSINRYLHRLLLEQEGVHVTTAVNGKEAVEKYKAQAENNPFDLILMDVQMPEMDGFTAAKFIRSWELEKKKKMSEICFVTGEYFSEEEVVSKFKHLGGNTESIRSLRKPLDIEIIRKLIISCKSSGSESG